MIQQTLLTALMQITRQAGEAILEVYQGPYEISHKQDTTPVTDADLIAHQLLVSTLHDLAPQLPILSEESPLIPLSTRRQWKRYWLIDPLDGTLEFIRKTGEFSVNVALVEKNRPVFGLVYAPVSGTFYYAQKGLGAYRQKRDQPAERIYGRQLQPKQLVVTTSSRSRRDRRTLEFLSRLPDYQLLTMGSALKSCLIAEGKADIYPRIGPTSEWDTAAAQIIVEEAGGQLTDMNLQPLRYNTRETLLNPDFLAVADANFDWRQFLAEPASC
ncbi:MAG: 3'(2'),5'-bisphosphate nucleotidase CysQ [Gammaproteobacteria bacterium]|nr:3'(2'),5'-bisphosphate nucleotidase CysQ [Gammaproteobacteria bacterium]